MRRSTDTTIVLSILSLTTRPTLVLRLPCTAAVPSVIVIVYAPFPVLAATRPVPRSRWTVRMRAMVRSVWGMLLL